MNSITPSFHLTPPFQLDALTKVIRLILENVEEHELTKRRIAAEIDLKLGFNIKKIEETLRTQALQINPETFFDEWGPILHDGAQTWVGLDFQILQSNYHDLKTLFQYVSPKPHQTIVDLGAGYGRMGIFLHWFYPQTSFLGIELVPERVQEANRIYSRLQVQNKKMIAGNLTHLNEIPTGDIYFLYDFGSVDHIQKVLSQLKKLKGKQLIVKGRICYNLMQKNPEWGPGIKIKKLEDFHLFPL